MDIRSERPEDEASVSALLVRAFEGEDEARLVEALRRDGAVIAALVAIENGAVIGQVLFSRMQLDGPGKPLSVASLAPVAVEPARQRLGIGAALCEAGLEACRAAGIDVVFVLGHPNYYPRFGFSAGAARHFETPFPGDAFMVLDLQPGCLEGRTGRVRYAPAFGLGPEWST